MISQLILILVVIFTSYWLWYNYRQKAILIFHLVFLCLTPWVLTLFFGHPSLQRYPLQKSPDSINAFYERISANLAYLSSDDFLFFVGDGRPGYGTGENGMFLLSFLPLILIGTFETIIKNHRGHKLIFAWLIGGLTLSVFSSNVAGLPAALWYLPSLSILASLGGYKAFELLTGPKSSLTVKALLLLNFLWIIYETLLLYHAIIIHQPFQY